MLRGSLAASLHANFLNPLVVLRVKCHSDDVHLAMFDLGGGPVEQRFFSPRLGSAWFPPCFLVPERRKIRPVKHSNDAIAFCSTLHSG